MSASTTLEQIEDQGAPGLEIREAGGNGTDLLISNNTLGRALAALFDGSDIVPMRGTSLRRAGWRGSLPY